VDSLIGKLSSLNNFIANTYSYGGRWVLIVNDGKDVRLYTDAVGLRQVFFSLTDYTRELWCASQPRMIAEILRLDMDEKGVELINSHEFRLNTEFRWPGSSTPYREVEHLLPNHYLDLTTGSSRRYWPEGPLPELSLGEAVDSASGLLEGLMQSASNRFELALSLTAGIDSRLVLAASRDIRNDLSFMTVRQITMPDDHSDVRIPSELLGKMGLKHDVVGSSLLVDDDFIEVFKKNVAVPHYVYAPDAQAILRYYGQRKVAVTGSASEVARSSFRANNNLPRNKDITIKRLAALQDMDNLGYALERYEQWRAGIGDLFNLNIMSLFEWELDDGNWLAMCQLEFDIAWKDIFTPFNCRDVIMTMLSVNPELTLAPKHQLYHALIAKLWPEVLNTPINPHKNYKGSIHSRVKAYAKRKLKSLIR
jgi:hypothetical protein